MFGLSRALLGSVLFHAGLLTCVGIAWSSGNAPRGLHVALVLTEPDPVPTADPELPTAEEEPARLEPVASTVTEEAAAPAVDELEAGLASPAVADAARAVAPAPADAKWHGALVLEQVLQPVRRRSESPPLVAPLAALPDPAPPPAPREATTISALPGVNEPPAYPPLARKRRLEGRVDLGVEVDVAGRVLQVTVLRSSGHGLLDDAALCAVRSWHFSPGPGHTELAIRFRLDDP